MERFNGPWHVIAVKGCIFDLPFADCGVGLDWPRLGEWQYRFGEVSYPVYWGVAEAVWQRNPIPLPDNVTLLVKTGDYGFSDDPTRIHGGGTSGFCALSLAVMKRARKIVLFGYDYRPDNENMHHNDQHYIEPRRQRREYWHNWARSYGIVAPELERRGIEVINGSHKSEVTAFPRCTVDEAFQHLARV